TAALLQEPGGNACGIRTCASVLECGCPLPLSVLAFVDRHFNRTAGEAHLDPAAERTTPIVPVSRLNRENRHDRSRALPWQCREPSGAEKLVKKHSRALVAFCIFLCDEINDRLWARRLLPGRL